MRVGRNVGVEGEGGITYVRGMGGTYRKTSNLSESKFITFQNFKATSKYVVMSMSLHTTPCAPSTGLTVAGKHFNLMPAL